MRLIWILLGLALASAAVSAPLGLTTVDARPLSRGPVVLQLTDPRTGKAPEAARFTLSASATREAKRTVISGVVAASGAQETVCQLQAQIPIGELGWLFWDDMSRSRPIRPGEGFAQSVYPICCVTDPTKRDGLAVALDPDPLQPATLAYDPALRAVIVTWNFGFTPLARPELRMKAPFSFEIYRVLPGWAFRSALDGYYHFHPRKYDWRAKHEGMWLFASDSATLPNPQHYAYDEGGLPPTPDVPRGIATFPYCCTGDSVVSLPGDWGLAKNYDEMLQRLERWEKLPRLEGWDILGGYEADRSEKRSGERSLKFTAAKQPASGELRQTFELNQKKVDPLTVTVWAKTQDVTGSKDSDCGVWVDMTMADGTSQFGKVASVEVGTHDWQQLKVTLGADKPIGNARLYLLFRNAHAGTIWFDDLSATLASSPTRNLAQSPGFESSGPPRQATLLRDNVMFDENDHMRYFVDTYGGADIPPASPLNWLRFVLLVNDDQRNPQGRPTASSTDFGMYDRIFAQYPQCKGAYMDGTSAGCTTTFEYRRDHFQWLSDPFQYLGTTFRPCGSGKASVIRWVDAFKRHFPGKLAFGNVWASNTMWDVAAALDIPGYESSRYYDLPYADYYRAAAYHKPALLLNYFRIGQYLDTREGGERFFRYATAYGLFPSIGRYTDEAYEKFGDLQHLYVPIVKRLFRAGWEPVTYAAASDPNVQVQRFGGAPGRAKLPMYFTVLNPGPTPRTVDLTVDCAALGFRADEAEAIEMATSANLFHVKGSPEMRLKLSLGPDDVAVVAVLPAIGNAVGAWYRERAAETLQGAAYVYAQTPPTVEAATLAQQVRQIAERTGGTDWVAQRRTIAPLTDAVLRSIHRLRTDGGKLPDSLKRRSYLRDLTEAERLLTEALLTDAGGRADLSGLGTVVPLDAEASFHPAVSGPFDLQQNAIQAWPGRLVELPVFTKATPTQSLPDGLKVGCPTERAMTAGADLVFTDYAGVKRHIVRRGYAFFGPVCELATKYEPGAPTIGVRLRNSDIRPRAFHVALKTPDGMTATPAAADLSLAAGEGRDVAVSLVFAPGLKSGTYPVKVTAVTDKGVVAEGNDVSVVYVLPLAPDDLALANAGAHLAVDSAYYAYDERPLNDGIVLPGNQAFNASAWASGDAQEDHWVEIQWPQSHTVSRAAVYWNVENGTVWTSRQFQVQVKQGGAWRTVAESRQTDAQPVTECSFAPAQASALRILQPKGEGPASRPNIMWLREIAVYAR